MKPIYLDNNATTPLDPRVLEAMMPFLTDNFGNAASRSHSFGQVASDGVEQARQELANLLGAGSPQEIIWTSGATESDNIAVKGVARMYREKGTHIITQATEHKAILDPCGQCLSREGFRITFLPVGQNGRIDLNELEDAIDDNTTLVSIMFANNEVGVIQPIPEIGRICKEKGVLFHTDATQAVGKIPIDVEAMGIDLLSCSAHKMYGPKGVGALFVRRKNPRVRCEAIFHGGGHERGMRSGTLNTPGIVGMGAAARIAREEMPQESLKIETMRNRLWNGIQSQIDELKWNGGPDNILPNTLNISFAYVEGEGLMLRMKNLAVSSGSACTSASLEPSYVLRAMGVDDAMAHSSLRFSLGRFNTDEEIDQAIDSVVNAVQKQRELSPLYDMARQGIDPSTVEWTEH